VASNKTFPFHVSTNSVAVATEMCNFPHHAAEESGNKNFKEIENTMDAVGDIFVAENKHKYEVD
jgi:hypothetical protein